MNTIQSSSAAGSSGRPDPSQMAQAFFKKIDADNDGQVSEAEFTDALQKRFGTSDSAKGKIAAAFQKTDSDSDGKVNLDEFTAAMKQMGPRGAGGRPPPPPPPEEDSADSAAVASAADTDRDGKVSLDELQADFEKRVASKTGAKGDQPDFTELIKKLDSDNDGSLSVDEFKSLLEDIKSRRHHEHGGPRYDGTGRDSATDVSGATVETEA